ncbi:MAG TPA: DUF397 domain-containing protein [Streptosporangiaceae bacterium]|nr:DUF397 domain-containing protein [Streptosporangiaceae bacterium]
MSSPASGISAREISAPWIKSSRSGPTGGNCVEIAFLAGGAVAMRNSRDTDGPALVFTAAEWEAFLGGARDGEFGLPS